MLPTCHVFAGLPAHKARAVLADPPWHFRSYTGEIGNRDVRNHYDVMSRRRILDLPVQDLVDPRGAHLFLWTTAPFLQFSFQVLEAWGFRYSSIAFVWAKLNARVDPDGTFTQRDFAVGLGHTTRKSAEICLLARCRSPRRRNGNVRELIVAPRRQHSRKPDEIRERIEAYSVGPYYELFARSTRHGWHSWGIERHKFADEAYRGRAERGQKESQQKAGCKE
jgi:N6-adenosine-specific RNA methylase IME4